MKLLCALMLLLLPLPSLAQLYRCSEPQGTTMWSNEGHKIDADGFRGVAPLVSVDGNKMTVQWDDSAVVGGTPMVWKTKVFHLSANAISGTALDTGRSASAAMIFTMDLKRNFLYMTVHKDNSLANVSTASSYVAKYTR